MKNFADQGGRYPQRPKTEVDIILRDLHILRKPNNYYSFKIFPRS